MKTYEVAGGLFWLGLSIYVMIESARLGLGTPNNPNMGFLPFWTAAFLASLSLYVTGRAIFAKFAPDADAAPLFARRFVTNLVPSFIALVVYAVTMPTLGFLLGTFLVMSFLFYLAHRGPIWHSLVAAAITTILCQSLFQDLLRTQFPRGIFGF